MIRSCIRQAVRGFAGAALIACAIAAQAASITINAANCASYTTSADQSGNVTIACVPANGTGPLTGCQIQGSSNASFGTPDSLTAVCSGGAQPTNWSWAGGSCANNTTQGCQANETGTSSFSQTYTVTVGNGINSVTTPGFPVQWSPPSAAKPSGCSVTPSPSSLPATGGSVSLTAQCTGGNPVSWVWSGATYTTT